MYNRHYEYEVVEKLQWWTINILNDFYNLFLVNLSIGI